MRPSNSKTIRKGLAAIRICPNFIQLSFPFWDSHEPAAAPPDFMLHFDQAPTFLLPIPHHRGRQADSCALHTHASPYAKPLWSCPLSQSARKKRDNLTAYVVANTHRPAHHVW